MIADIDHIVCCLMDMIVEMWSDTRIVFVVVVVVVVVGLYLLEWIQFFFVFFW